MEYHAAAARVFRNRRCRVMPLRCEAFVVVVLFLKDYHSSIVAERGVYLRNKDDLPTVPGCRLFKREDNLGLSAYCNSFNFPETPSSFPNNIIFLQVYGVYDLNVEIPLFKSMVNLRELELPSNRLQEITPRMLEGLSDLRYLGLRNNDIKKLLSDTFVHNALLEKIDLSDNFILSVAAVTHCLSKLVHLTEINLADNMIISSLTLRDFSPLRNTSFQSLNMAGCPIGQIEENAFEPLKKLSVLDLSNTLLNTVAVRNVTKSMEFSSLRRLKLSNLRYLSSFPAEFFRRLNMSSIEVLDFSFNRIPFFPLKGNLYPNLKSLDMTACDLQNLGIPGDFLTSKLETLILKRNKILGITRQFAYLTKLKHLDISDPSYIGSFSGFTIKDYAFQNLINLECIKLDGQPIRHGISRHTFYGLEGLIRLQLSRCFISFIEEYSFETLHNLESLDLSFNNIEFLNNNMLYGLRNVRSVNLANNIVTSFNRSNPFQHTLALESLILNDNKIRQLQPGIFEGLLQLGIIKLANNFIVPWHKRLLPQNGSVSALDISRNRISYFSVEMLDDVRQLQSLDFSYNPLNCSACEMKDLQLWINNTSIYIYLLHQTSTELSPYACAAPPKLANMSILEAEIPVGHCIPETLDLLAMLLGIIIPLFLCLLIASVLWHFLAWHIRYCCFRVKSRVRSYKGVSKSDRYVYDAFVSYSPSDVLWVRNQLMPALESDSRECRLCIPDRDFEASINVTENVFGAVQNSRTTILVLSNAYLDSEWCKFDMDMAQHKLFEDTRSLILILLEEVDSAKMTKNLKYIIKTRTYIPWTNNVVGQKLFWERLHLAVARPNEKVLLKHIT